MDFSSLEEKYYFSTVDIFENAQTILYIFTEKIKPWERDHFLSRSISAKQNADLQICYQDRYLPTVRF